MGWFGEYTDAHKCGNMARASHRLTIAHFYGNFKQILYNVLLMNAKYSKLLTECLYMQNE